MKINYDKKIKHYNLNAKPYKQKFWTKFIVYPASWLALSGYQHKFTRINMKGVKPPYLLLINHAQFLDFKVVAVATFPHSISNVVSIDGFTICPWLLRQVGSIPKRKFNNSLSLVKSMIHVLKSKKSIVGLYPEARFTTNGATSPLPDSLGKMIKLCKVPVVTFICQGHYLNRPAWGYFRARKKVPIKATIKRILTAEEIEKLSPEEIMVIVRREFQYDDYKYQLENNIQVNDPFRAEGLHRVLYKCPECKSDCRTQTEGAVLRCSECSNQWELKPNGSLECLSGKTRFDKVLDWFEWQRGEIRKEVESGSYCFEDEMEAFSLPDAKKFIPLGKVKVTHSIAGFSVKGHYNGEDFELVKGPLENYCIQQEFTSPYCDKKDIIGISTKDDTLFLVPSNPAYCQRLVLATEEMYKFVKEKNV